jgi:hypothetical protein
MADLVVVVAMAVQRLLARERSCTIATVSKYGHPLSHTLEISPFMRHLTEVSYLVFGMPNCWAYNILISQDAMNYFTNKSRG